MLTHLLIYSILGVTVSFLLLCAFCPLIYWASYFKVFGEVLDGTWFPKKSRRKLTRYLRRDLLLAPLKSILWLVDETLYRRRLNSVQLEPPVFIISQPRSGSTFLHRVMAEDEENFFAITYFEWKYPYMFLWWLIDKLGLRSRIYRKNYWSNDSVGFTASKMHQHLYGDYEEHGIFLEEMFYHHYFVFRRFPFSAILNDVDFNTLSKLDQERIVRTFVRVVSKVALYRGKKRIWVTKENESVAFYRCLLKVFPEARVVFLVRNPKPMLKSYLSLSLYSTLAKTGVNMAENLVWHTLWRRANIEFRRRECAKFLQLYEELKSNPRAVLLGYKNLIGSVYGSVSSIYSRFGLSIPEEQRIRLADLTIKQHSRNREYETGSLATTDLIGFEDYSKLVEKVNESTLR